MDEYIKREDVLRAYEEEQRRPGPYRFETLIKSVPSSDVAPVRHGRWDSSGKYRFQADNSVAVRCTECGCCLTEPEYREYTWNYCPVCGSKMDGVHDG